MATRRWLIALALLVSALLAQRACSSERGKEVGVTTELAGIWTTRSAKHADRFIEIRPGEIVFGQGEAGESRHSILGVRLSSGPAGRSTYVVRYRIESAELVEGKLELLVGRENLYLANQPAIRWTRER